jgi:hypothetical protein
MGRIILGISRDPNIPRVRINSENRETVCFKTSKAIPLLCNRMKKQIARDGDILEANGRRIMVKYTHD